MARVFFVLYITLCAPVAFSQSQEFRQIQRTLDGFVSTPRPTDSSLIKKALVSDGILPSIYSSQAEIELRIITKGRMGDSFVLSIRVFKDSIVADRFSFFDVTKNTDISKPGYANFKTAEVATRLYYSDILSGNYKLIFKQERLECVPGFSSWVSVFESLRGAELFSGIDGQELDRRMKTRYPNVQSKGFGFIEIDIKNGDMYRSMKFGREEYFILGEESAPGSSLKISLNSDLDLKYYYKLLTLIDQIKSYQQ